MANCVVSLQHLCAPQFIGAGHGDGDFARRGREDVEVGRVEVAEHGELQLVRQLDE